MHRLKHVGSVKFQSEYGYKIFPLNISHCKLDIILFMFYTQYVLLESASDQTKTITGV